MIKIIYGHWNSNTFSAELYLFNEDIIVIPLRELNELSKTYVSSKGVKYHSVMEGKDIIGFEKINQVVN